MRIDVSNAHQGNQAMAWVLLLYYHLLREGGITHDQTVYVDSKRFNAFENISVDVAPDLQSEINQQLIRRGSTICLLCELKDMVDEYEADYLEQPFTQKILSALSSEPAIEAVPELVEIVETVSNVQAPLNHAVLQGMLQRVFATYVVEEVWALVASKPTMPTGVDH